jgi:hypothetical protein
MSTPHPDDPEVLPFDPAEVVVTTRMTSWGSYLCVDGFIDKLGRFCTFVPGAHEVDVR